MRRLEHKKYWVLLLRQKWLLYIQVEWDILAAWVVANNLSSNNVVWLIQIPRLYNVYRDQGIIENFAQVSASGSIAWSWVAWMHVKMCCVLQQDASPAGCLE